MLIFLACSGSSRENRDANWKGNDGAVKADALPTMVDSASEPIGACQNLGTEVFCDDFDGTELNLDRWWYARKVWGIDNNGVIPENISVRDGYAWFASNGDQYAGDLYGMRKGAGGYIQDQEGKRVGGVLVSDKYFGPGKYEFRMALPEHKGVCSALWTFHYQEIYSNESAYNDEAYASLPPHGNSTDGWYKTPNHEIDIEIPSALKGQSDDQVSYRNARYNTWVGEAVYTDEFHDNGYNYNDGEFHTWRFDWHTGDDARVEFYIDDQLMYTSTTDIPFIHGRLWLGTWFPKWAGNTAEFDVTYMKLDWVRVTPFDQAVLLDHETYSGDGLTKCDTKAKNDQKLPECQLVSF